MSNRNNNNLKNKIMKYAVVYFNEQGQDKYVGSLMDYKAGEFSADPILMSDAEANELLEELDNYVRNEEFKNNDNADAALYAYEQGRWGFYVEDLDFGYLDYMGALVNYGGDPLLIEDEEDAASLAKAIERAQYGIREIEKDSEEWNSALKGLDLADVNDVKHIYSGVDGSEFIFCKAEDWK